MKNLTLVLVGCLALPVEAKIIRSSQDLKFFEVLSPDRPAKYLGFTSSKLDNVVEVPSASRWYVRPDGKLTPESFQSLLEEIKKKDYPGLDVSDRWDITNEMLAILRDSTSLKILKMSNTRVNDNGLEILDALPKLEQLSLSNQVTNKGLKKLMSLKRLKALELHHAKISDAGLSALESLPRLELLDLSNSAVTDQGTKTLAKIASLRYLDVSGTSISDRGMNTLSALSRLEVLYANAKVTDKGLAAIGRMKSLKTLDLSGTSITAAGLKQLSDLKSLEALALSDTAIGDEAMDTLLVLKSLKTLELSGTRVGASGLEKLGALPRLEVLSLSWTHLSGPDIAALREMKRLDRVILNGRTVDRETLSRFKSFAKKSPYTAPKGVVQRVPVPVKAPESRPAIKSVPMTEKKVIATRAVRESHVAPVYRKIEMPRDLPTEAHPVASIPMENAPRGKGMMIEVAAGPSAVATSRSVPRLTGLKRLHQVEMDATPADLALENGAQPVIGSQDPDPKNFLGELNIKSR